MGNAGIVDLGDRTLVFDTFSNHLAAEELRVAAETVTGKAVDYVVLSHAHRDHVKGTQVFEHATIAADAKTAETMTRNWKARTDRVAREGLDPIRRDIEKEFAAWMSKPSTTEDDRVLWEGYQQSLLQGIDAYRLRLPDVSFETAMRFHGSRGTAEALTFGGGHSAGDTLLFVPDSGVLFLGDLLFIGVQPYLGDGDPKHYLRILDRIEALGARSLVPGHGPVGTSRDLRPMRDYVLAVEKSVAELRSAGARPDEAAHVPIPEPFREMKWRAFWGENLEFFLTKAQDAAKP